jgi:glyoxylase-like metal-dependent hydrolase (beta-lactamase superfamily II)
VFLKKHPVDFVSGQMGGMVRITDNVYVLSGSYYSATDIRGYDQLGVLGEVYGIRTDEGVILVDCGLPGTGLAMIRENMCYYDLGEIIPYLIITHAHNDHAGNAREIQQMGARVIAGARDVSVCINGGLVDRESPFDREQVFPAFTPDITIDRDQIMELCGFSINFITIPGHTPGSIAVQIQLDRRNILFTGDSLWPLGDTLLVCVSFGWQGDPGFSREALVNSIMKLWKTQTDVILPGHGKLCLKNGTDMLRLAAKEVVSRFR